MGREIKRVPVDFDWPLNKVWQGYLMPDSLHERECADCVGEGYGREARAVANTFYPHQIEWDNTEKANALAWHDKIGQAEVDNLIAEGRLCVLRRREPTEDNPLDWEWVSEPRTADEINALNRRGGIDGHDGINRMILIRFRCERLGIRVECATCDGHGCVEAYPGQRAEAEAWERTEPPAGDGWQLWETVSEGSPISPVFADADGLVDWLCSPAYTWGASTPTRREQAERFVQSGWAPSFVASAATGVVPGDQFVGGRS